MTGDVVIIIIISGHRSSLLRFLRLRLVREFRTVQPVPCPRRTALGNLAGFRDRRTRRQSCDRREGWTKSPGPTRRTSLRPPKRQGRERRLKIHAFGRENSRSQNSIDFQTLAVRIAAVHFEIVIKVET